MEAPAAARRSNGMEVIMPAHQADKRQPGNFPLSEKILTLGHNLALVSVLYFSERPE